MKERIGTPVLLLVCWLGVVSCDRDRQSGPEPSESPSAGGGSPRASEPSAPPTGDSVRLGVHRPDELVDAAKAVVGFLRGEVDFDRIRLADTVTLYVSPEGGGAPRLVPRAMLRQPSNWKVRSESLPNARARDHTFAPPRQRAELTTRVGQHLNCVSYPLASRAAELARLPHVGTMLMFGEQGGCLNSWNLTLVFDPDERPPTLVAAVYDQWEW